MVSLQVQKPRFIGAISYAIGFSIAIMTTLMKVQITIIDTLDSKLDITEIRKVMLCRKMKPDNHFVTKLAVLDRLVVSYHKFIVSGSRMDQSTQRPWSFVSPLKVNLPAAQTD